jgi:hypothetical protein
MARYYRAMPGSRLVFALVVAVLSSACASTVFTAQGGYVRPAEDRDGQTGGAVNLYGGAFVNRDSNLGMEMALRFKGASNLKQGAMGMSLISIPFGAHVVMPFGRAGVHELQFESVNGDFGFGMFSPFAEAGLMIRTKRRRYGGGTFFTISAFGEYDLRFNSPKSGAYWGIAIGITGIDFIRDPAKPWANPCGGNPCGPNPCGPANPCARR